MSRGSGAVRVGAGGTGAAEDDVVGADAVVDRAEVVDSPLREALVL